MKTIRYQLAILATAIASTTMAQTQKYPTQLLEHESQIESIIKGMTLEEKIASR